MGVAGGIFAFGELYPVIEPLVNATSMGTVTIPRALGLRTGLIVFAVVLMAVLGFWGASALERRLARAEGEVPA